MRQLSRRFRACESGAGTVEYALLIAIIALSLIGILTLFRNAVGGATDRATVGVSRQTAGGYGVNGAGGGGSGGGAIAQGPPTGAVDNPSPEPDSSAASDGTDIASSHPGKP